MVEEQRDKEWYKRMRSNRKNKNRCNNSNLNLLLQKKNKSSDCNKRIEISNIIPQHTM